VQPKGFIIFAQLEKVQLSQQPSSRFGSICWLNMIPTNSGSTAGPMQQDTVGSASSAQTIGKSTESGLSGNSFVQPVSSSPGPQSSGCCSRMLQKMSTVVRWVFQVPIIQNIFVVDAPPK
jgi:hypothetical protein